jgi:hypothetical protein
MPSIPLDALSIACIDPPSLLAPTHVWLRYFRDLRQMQQCGTVRHEIKRARQELAHRRQDQIRKRAELASRQLDLFPVTAPRVTLPPPRPFGNPLVQLVFGEALIKTGLNTGTQR